MGEAKLKPRVIKGALKLPTVRFVRAMLMTFLPSLHCDIRHADSSLIQEGVSDAATSGHCYNALAFDAGDMA